MKSCCVFLGFIAGGWCRSLQGEGVHPGCHSVWLVRGGCWWSGWRSRLCMKHRDRAGPEFGLQGGSNVADDSKHNVFVDWSKLLTWLYLPHRKSLVPSSLLELSWQNQSGSEFVWAAREERGRAAAQLIWMFLSLHFNQIQVLVNRTASQMLFFNHKLV